jgi:RHS repeat-associated protein
MSLTGKINYHFRIILIALLLSAFADRSLAQTNVVPDNVELQILKNLYDSLGGTTWKNKSNWPTPGSWPASATAAQMDAWWGIVVTNGDITGLSLSSNNLTGQIPKTISQLTKLNNISFQGNLIAGAIPSRLGNLTSLTALYLHSNKLTGVIPATLNNLTGLQILYLSNNLLTGDIPNLGSLINLRQLYLGTNSYNPGLIPSWLNNLTLLNVLDLTNSKRNGIMPPSLGSLTTLTSLILGTNQLTGSIPSTLGSLPNLQYLYLNNNQLTGSIPESIGNLSNLIQLYLHTNQLSGPIPSSFGNLKKLQLLYLHSNQLTGTIPASLGSMTALINLYLYTNQLSGTIPASLGNLTNLTALHLSSNQLTGSIPTELGNLTKLTQLFLHVNKLGGSIPPSLSYLINLTHLYLSTNQLTGELPPSLGSLTKLIYFYCGANQLTGTIPSSYSNWINIYLFDISAGKFSGVLPANLFLTWTKLVSLNISNNNFTGSFPASISSCVLLSGLTARVNKFTGLPNSILSLPVATTINFDANDLTTIPNFGTHVNKINLALTVRNNFLDFSNLAPLVGVGIKTLTHTPQKDIVDVSSITMQQTSPMVINTRPTGLASTVTWEKLGANGVTWASVTTNDQDAVPSSFTRTSATVADEGTYRWRMTNTTVTGMTLQSAPIIVKTAKRFAMDQWVFQYKYDARQRMIAKKVPGADWVYMVYDKRDRLVLSQDAEQRKFNRWSFTKYDVLNRPVTTGIYTHPVYVDQGQMQFVVDTYYNTLTATKAWFESFSATAGNIHNYDNKSFPQVIDPAAYLTVTYYDNYLFKQILAGTEYNYRPGQLVNQENIEFNRVTGQVTGTKTKVLYGVGDYAVSRWLNAVTYFDDRYRVIQTVSNNETGSISRNTNVYDFTGKVLASRNNQEGNAVNWKDIVGGTVIKGYKISRSASGSDFTCAAASSQTLSAGTDGWFEFTHSNANMIYVGFSDVNIDSQMSTIDYCLRLGGSSAYAAHVNGSTATTIGSHAIGDIFRVERVNGSIKVRRNGNLEYTFPGLSTSQLLIDVSFYSGASELSFTRSSFGVGENAIVRTFTYDHAGRLLKTFHSLNGATPVLLTQNEYNELGQLVDKKQYSTDGTIFKQSVDYRYNIRGWLTSINNAQLAVNSTNDDTNDLFGMELAYNNSLTGLGNAAMYNGNISAMKWSVNQGLGTPVFGTPTERAYNFVYDPLNRLKSASHLNNIGAWAANTSFNEDNLSYDYNGNIKTLSRKGQGGSVMDVLTYDYGTGNSLSNQLLKVTDTGDKTKGFVDGANIDNDYVYDANGSMNADKNKAITAITYNHLNLPVKVTKSTGDYIIYTYNAGGAKLSQSVYTPANLLKKKSDYVGEYFYENDTLKVINHEEGRVTMTGATPEYQYNLKDHLGNVRLTFTTKTDVQANTATMETANVPTEQGQFLNYTEAIKVNTPIFDRTNVGPTFYSTRLTGKTAERIGLAKSLSVMPGDKIEIEVFAKYLDTNPTNLTPALAAFIASIATGGGAPAGTIIDGGYAGSLGNGTFPFPGVLPRTGDVGTGPKAYLNYLVFDRDYVYKTGGFKRLSTAARETGTDIAHERLAFDGVDQILIREPGYVYIWLSNENDTPVEVYFDDFKVTHTKSPVIQQQDYYPFGLTFNSYSRESSLENRYLYNQGTGEKTFNTERVFDLGLNIDLSRYRSYDPAIGRWWQVDPLAADIDELLSLTPYNYSFNNPIRYNDPEGDCPCLALPIIIEAIAALTTAEVATGAAVAAGGATAITFQDELAAFGSKVWEAMGNASPYSTPAVDAAQSAGGTKSLNTDTKRSASDQKLIDQAKQQKAKDDKTNQRTQTRQQQTQQGKEKEGKSNKETRGSHDSGNKSKAGKGDHENANARRAKEQAKADQKKEESKKKN